MIISDAQKARLWKMSLKLDSKEVYHFKCQRTKFQFHPYVEHFDSKGKTHAEVVRAIQILTMTAGITLSAPLIERWIRKARFQQGRQALLFDMYKDGNA